MLETSLVSQIAISPTYHAKNTGPAQLKSASPGSTPVLAAIVCVITIGIIYDLNYNVIHYYWCIISIITNSITIIGVIIGVLLLVLLDYYYWCITSSTAQGGGGSFKNRKPIGELGCCE